MTNLHLAHYLSSIFCICLIWGQIPHANAQHHELGITSIKTTALSLDVRDRIFEPSIRYTYLRENWGFRAMYAWHNTNKDLNRGILYPARGIDAMHYFGVGVQYSIEVKKFLFYGLLDLGGKSSKYRNTSGNGKLSSTHIEQGKLSGVSLRPGIGMKYNLFSRLYLGLELQYQIDLDRKVGSWERYYVDINPNGPGNTLTSSGTFDETVFSAFPFFSGLIISWRF